MKLLKVGSGVNVLALRWALRENPQFWNEHTARTQDPTSPHYGLDDIWLRFSADGQNTDGHESVWYPSAQALGAIPLVEAVVQCYGGTVLGGVLLTRIPPGAMCRPHQDHGWHARYYEKFAVQIESAPGQRFHVEDESLETKPGDVFWFDNEYTHWVTNPTRYERVTLIACMRR